MSNQDFDPLHLNESQQLALGTYTSVTNQEPSAAVPLLQRSEWNVQVRHALSIYAKLIRWSRLTALPDCYRQILRRGNPRPGRRSSRFLAILYFFSAIHKT